MVVEAPEDEAGQARRAARELDRLRGPRCLLIDARIVGRPAELRHDHRHARQARQCRHVEQVDAVRGVAHRERRAPQRVGVHAEEIHRHAVGAQPRRPGGRIAAGVAIAREVAGGDLRQRGSRRARRRRRRAPSARRPRRCWARRTSARSARSSRRTGAPAGSGERDGVGEVAEIRRRSSGQAFGAAPPLAHAGTCQNAICTLEAGARRSARCRRRAPSSRRRGRAGSRGCAGRRGAIADQST